MARDDPELAARLVLQTLPAAAARLRGPISYDLDVGELGTWRVSAGADGTSVERRPDGSERDPSVDFTMTTDAGGLALLAAGRSPLRLMLGGRVRIRGKRRRAMRLRAMSNGPDPSLGDAIQAGGQLDPDAVFRALEYMIDPEWTRGHRFAVVYELTGDGGGRWRVDVNDGERVRVVADPPVDGANATMQISVDTYRRLIAGELTPAQSMREQHTRVEGEIYPGTLLGRWMDRSQGRDDAELAREARQREVQAARAGTWGSAVNGTSPAVEAESVPDSGDPGHSDEAAERRRGGRDLLSYEQLYALWERQNWRAHELDFSVDREQWLASPREAQENMLWSLGSFYIGEERVTADLAPFVMAAPSGEVEIFLSTQLVDEARHAAFFDRFGAEVMALGGDDVRGRIREIEQLVRPAWFETFDDGLRDVAKRIQARPDDFDLFVEGITTYHLIIEGVLATTGQRMILDYAERHSLYPGFCKGFSLVEQDEHRHIAFGVRFLRDAVADDPERGRIVMRKVEELVPRAMYVFWPPYAESPTEFVSYGYDSTQIYGYAYRKLKRRLAVIGLDCPPPEDLMPGPIATAEEARAAGVAA
jgi:ribonucleoside-diphosphate reductase beta chain